MNTINWSFGLNTSRLKSPRNNWNDYFKQRHIVKDDWLFENPMDIPEIESHRIPL